VLSKRDLFGIVWGTFCVLLGVYWVVRGASLVAPLFIVLGTLLMSLGICGKTSPIKVIRFRRTFGFLPDNWREVYSERSEIDRELVSRTIAVFASDFMRSDYAERQVQTKMASLESRTNEELAELREGKRACAAALKRAKTRFWAAEQLADDFILLGLSVRRSTSTTFRKTFRRASSTSSRRSTAVSSQTAI